MVYGCRICNYDEIGDNKCVYRNDLLTVTKRIPTFFARVVERRWGGHGTIAGRAVHFFPEASSTRTIQPQRNSMDLVFVARKVTQLADPTLPQIETKMETFTGCTWIF
ncbi:hypothetical protein MPER_05287 [Moniliophthora perniciosa FA553]|nr:hypothetical protein MPER_05287 [Moniliophthora perniciosa FA553]